jgi:hypothetical protein
VFSLSSALKKSNTLVQYAYCHSHRLVITLGTWSYQQPEMEISYQGASDDLRAFLLFVWRSNADVQRHRKRMRIVLAIISAIILVLAGISWLWLRQVKLTVTIIVLAIVLYPYYRFSLNTMKRAFLRSLGRVYERSPNKLLGHHRVSLSMEGLLDTNEAGETEINWPDISASVMTEQYFFITGRGTMALAIPRRAFIDDQSYAIFAEDVKKHLG